MPPSLWLYLDSIFLIHALPLARLWTLPLSCAMSFPDQTRMSTFSQLKTGKTNYGKSLPELSITFLPMLKLGCLKMILKVPLSSLEHECLKNDSDTYFFTGSVFLATVFATPKDSSAMCCSKYTAYQRLEKKIIQTCRLVSLRIPNLQP